VGTYWQTDAWHPKSSTKVLYSNNKRFEIISVRVLKLKLSISGNVYEARKIKMGRCPKTFKLKNSKLYLLKKKNMKPQTKWS
jgi:hypothetical protein